VLCLFTHKCSSVLIENPDVTPEPRPQQAGQDLYFEVLELQPIRLALSFMRTERVSSDSKSVTYFWLKQFEVLIDG
jgi:hypothetical protein